jgi:hypothetical protein
VPSDADAAAAEAALAAMVYGENLLPTAQAWYAPDGPLTRLMGGELPPDETGVVEEEAQFGVGMLLGLLGDPEEAAETVEARLVAANAETFANARDWALAWPTAVQLSLPLFAWAGSPVSGFAELWERVRSTPNDPVGRLALFAVFLSRCQVRGHQGRPFAQLARIVGPARRMASFIGANDDARRILEEEVRGMFPTEDLADPVVLLFCAAQVPNRRAALRVARLLWPHGLADYRRLSKGMQTNRNRATIG